jgi:ABC-type multidrug transport system fused ATPase/permease subunit
MAALAWVARDALPRYRGRVALIVLCNFLAIAAAAGALGGVMLYARHAEHGQPITLLGWTMHFSDSLASLAMFGGAIATLGVLSAVCQYATDRLILSTARQYHQTCAERALAIVSDPLCRGWQLLGEDDERPRRLAGRMLGSAARQTAFALRDMLRIMLPILTFAAALAFLVWIDWRLTLGLLPAGLVYLLPLYLINRQVTRRQREYRLRSREARGEVGRRMRERLAGIESRETASSAEAADPLHGAAYRGALAALYARLLADRRTQMLNTAFFVACLVALLMFFGVQAREHGRPWSDLLFYVLALRFAMTSLRQTTTLIAKFSRFFPEYRAYGSFLAAAEAIRARRAESKLHPQPLPPSLSIRIGKRGLWDSPRALKVAMASQDGETAVAAMLWALTPLAPDRADLEALAAALERRIDEGVDLATNALFIARLPAMEEHNAAIDTAPIIFIADNMFRRRPAQAMLERARGLIVVVGDSVDTARQATGERKADAHVIVVDGQTIVGGGDARWLEANAEAIRAELTRRAAELQRRSGSAAGESDDEVDEDDDAA